MEPVTSPVMDSSQPVLDTPVTSVPSQNVSERDQVKAMLAEARATRDMLVGFRSAVESGSYSGGQMLNLAKGLAFLEAILKQNNAHISNLQEKLNGK